MSEIIFLMGVLNAIVFFLCGYLSRKFISERKVKSAEQRAKEILEAAQREVEAGKQKVKLEAKERMYKLRAQFERETKERRYELLNLEKRLNQKEINLERKMELWERKEQELQQRSNQLALQERALHQKKKELSELIEEEKERLHQISNLTQEEARNILLTRVQKDIEQEKNLLLKRAEEEIRRNSEQKAKEIISLAMQKCASEYVAEATVSVVNLPNDEMKGRIIGREGRNIRALEMATGIDVIVDDTPGAVVLSGFDAIRREIARITLERLTADGRIHPARIEEMVAKVKQEMEETIYKYGEEAAFEAGVQGLHKEEIKLLGKLRYRSSYGQNVLQHSLEVATLMGA
ncbi:MAG: ribonuclease Y, partial [Candidatus Omnitrophota bacterium]